MKTGLLQTNGDPLAAVVSLLKGLLEQRVVDEVLVPARVPSGGIQLSLFADAGLMDGVNPWAPVMPVQGARAVSNLAFTDPGKRVAAVLRPCESRAVVELIKLKQIRPEQLAFITVDCPGTFELSSFAESGAGAAEVSKGLLGGMQSGAPAAADGLSFRTSCTICEFPAAEWGALKIQVFGADAGGALGLEAEDDFAATLVGAGLAAFDDQVLEGRAAVVKSLGNERAKARDELIGQFQAEAGGLDKLRQAFSTCIRCYNCMENCPICYCKLCIFKSPTFDHPGEMYTRWAQRKGAQPMLAETTLFHLTRLNHMSTSCIGCGLCDTACPMGLPVASLFRSAAQGVQGMLKYQPGRSLDDPIPLSVFREDELQAETGAKD